ncbi:MAG: O-antigen ligase family protein [Bacteroidales bacterium]|nr:O-antigen ligase family protein [Bacteroidales bacterium]
MPLTRQQIHEAVYYYALIFIAVSLPLSIYTTSVFQLVLLANWLAEGRFREKWGRFKGNRALWVFLVLYLIHAIGLLWSTDVAYSMKDMRIKLPLLFIPLIVGTSLPLVKQQVNRILLFFSMGVFAASMASVMKLVGWLPGEVEGYRDLSLFISHIRFSLMIVLTLLIVVYFLFIQRNSLSRFERIFYLAGLIWFPVFLVLLKSLSGIVITGFLAFFLLVRAVFEIRDQAIRFMVFVPVIMIPLFSVIYLGHAVNKYYTFDEIIAEEIDAYTVEGNPYKNNPGNREVENGHYVWLHVCDVELEREWNRVSEIDYRGRTTNGNSVRGTLIRFLTSRGLRKDAVGIKQLSTEEIRAIEHGVANHIYMQPFKLYPRIYEVIWEIDRYRMGYDPNEKSVVQRYLYVDAGWKIAREKLFFGVGPGDVKQVFNDYYESIDSPLKEKWRRRAHNQFLTFLIAFGIIGLIICLVALVAPLFLAGRQRSFLAVGFSILMLLSMINEDTLETSAGATFVAFFYTLFVFGPDYPWLRRKLFTVNDDAV